MRADAQRNRDRIVEVAREVFRERGYDASLDDIAKRAGVGPGTLYRHFPTRDALLDAVMQVWVDRVTETTDKALTYEGPTREFVVGWFEAYVALISLHKGGPAKITSAMGVEDSPIATKTRILLGATQRIVDHLRAQRRPARRHRRPAAVPPRGRGRGRRRPGRAAARGRPPDARGPRRRRAAMILG